MQIKYNPKPEEQQDIEHDRTTGAILEYELQQTDYIIIKIAEAEALGNHDEAERIRTEHADTIARRAALRKAINTIKEKWEGTD